MQVSPTIRLGRLDEVKRIIEIEDLAGERYADVGLPPDLEGLSHEEVVEALEEKMLWVVVDDETPVGFALGWLRPNAMHLRELDVHPAWMGRGLGRGLVDHVSREAQDRDLSTVTLTTFRDVPWNAPLYRHWGFSEVEDSKLPAWLREIRQEEDDGELGQWPRVAMARAVT
ncbi:MAG: GNAT family N-acetyltransferase [Deltaproteobacteria bacterium]|nr:GNAT family N-acetyltransferase [Deltaproteobacteria bacterium]